MLIRPYWPRKNLQRRKRVRERERNSSVIVIPRDMGMASILDLMEALTLVFDA